MSLSLSLSPRLSRPERDDDDAGLEGRSGAAPSRRSACFRALVVAASLCAERPSPYHRAICPDDCAGVLGGLPGRVRRSPEAMAAGVGGRQPGGAQSAKGGSSYGGDLQQGPWPHLNASQQRTCAGLAVWLAKAQSPSAVAKNHLRHNSFSRSADAVSGRRPVALTT